MKKYFDYKFKTYKQASLILDNWPTDSGEYRELEYIIVNDINGKEVIHLTMQEFVNKFMNLRENYKKSQLMFARINKYRAQYKLSAENWKQIAEQLEEIDNGTK